MPGPVAQTLESIASMTKTMYRRFWIITVFAALGTPTCADEQNAEAVDRSSLVRATRIMRKIDKDGSGSFEKSESESVWKRYRRLDANGDQVISIDELRKERSKILEFAGPQKLNLVYKEVSDRKLLLDLYYPANQESIPDKASKARQTTESESGHPLIVYTHGGGWTAGSKLGIANGSFKAVFETLLDRGFAVASIDYRLCRPGNGVTMRDCVIDCKDAVRYLSKNNRLLGLDANRVFVMGDSAGGQIAQLLLLTPSESMPGDPELAATQYKMLAGVSWYGPSDFEDIELFNHDDRPDFRDRFAPRILGDNSVDADKLKRYREMSPVNFLTMASPPMLMIQGDKDTTIPVKHAHRMKRKADEVDAPVEVMIIRNAGHNWRRVDADIQPSREAIIERTVSFFIEHREP